jgi:hypothetical protein
MKIKNYIDRNNITQYYIYNKDNIKNYKIINDLNEYTDLTKNTLFICSSKIDIHFINFHKGKIWLFITDNFTIELYNNITNNIEEILTISEIIENLFQKNNNEILNINSYEIKPVENSLLYIINASFKDKYIERYNKLLEYLKTFNNNYLIILCGNETKKENNILYVKCNDYYEKLPKKMILAFEWIYKNTLYTHIYKVDDDFYNNINKIFLCDYYGNKEIKRINNKYHFGKCENKKINKEEYMGTYTNPYAAGGYGYILSRESIFILLNNKNYIINELYEDKAIGDVLFKNNIKLKNNKLIKKKCAVIFYHKNIKKIYKERWYKKTVETILNQTYKNFDILEINYGGDNYSVLESFTFSNKHYFYKKKLNTHTEAMVYLLNIGFESYDVIFNTNLDDYYICDRFEKQLECIYDGYILCSSLMNYITENKDIDDDYVTLEWSAETYGMNPTTEKYINFNDIKEQLNKDHNVMCHPCITYTKEFWNSYDKYNNLLRYRDDKPFEDLTLWKRAINNNINMTIINEPLINYRLHENQIGEQSKKVILSSDVDSGFVDKPNDDKKRIGIFLIATGNYIGYFEDLLKSVEEKFLIDFPKVYIISTDNVEYTKNICNKYNVKYKIDFIYKKGFPLDTLYRYKYLLNHGIEIELLCDIIYYLDVDMKILENVGDEILPIPDKPYIGTKHPGFAYSSNKNGSPETRKDVTAYIDPSEYKECYIAGGFNGGYTYYFRKMAKVIQNRINIDKSKDLMAIWHDESQLNRYFIDNYDKFKILSTDYCYPENYHEKIPGIPKILALDKNHHKVRNISDKKKIVVECMGGLGNLLFQLYLGYVISIKYNLELCVKYNQKDEKRKSIFSYFMFDNITRIEFNEVPKDYHIIREKEKHYIDLISNIPLNKNVYLFGFFQSSLFFRDYIYVINKYINFEIRDIAKYIYNEIKKEFKNKKLVALHVRGSDYKKLSHYHTNLNITYYISALTKLKCTDSIKILFTDDYEYASNILNKLYNTFINNMIEKYIPKKYNYMKNHPELSLFILSCFDYIICANSTFSLWGSYFSNAEKIVIPKKWFGDDGPKDFKINELGLNDKYIIV